VHILRRLKAVPFRLKGGQLKVAIVDPADLGVIDELRLVTNHSVDIAVASQHDIELALRRLVRGSEFAVRAALSDEDEVSEVQDLEPVDDVVDEPAPARLVNSIIVQAAEDGASDVHFLPRADGLVIRVRIDGVVHEIDRVARSQAPGVVARIKVLGKLDIAEHRKPQDGRISMKTKRTGQQLDIRVAVLPTVDGEGVSEGCS
jgi:type IV pilus assembly protein PilB